MNTDGFVSAARFLHFADQMIILGTDGRAKMHASPEIVLRHQSLLEEL